MKKRPTRNMVTVGTHVSAVDKFTLMAIADHDKTTVYKLLQKVILDFVREREADLPPPITPVNDTSDLL